LQIPNEPAHIAAFLGALYDLTLWNSWQRDTAHRAIIASQLWKRLWTDLINDGFAKRACPVLIGTPELTLEDALSSQIRISPDDPCIIQMWCIDHWEDWYDPRSCTVRQVSQPGPGGTVVTGDCKTIHGTLSASQKFLIPFPIDDGYTIEISNVDGGWWNGDALLAWECPSGFTYALGECVSQGPLDSGNPIPSLPYGRLIAQVGGASLDAYNTTIIVPAGTGPVDVYLQMNDAVLADNLGSISFDVKVCNPSAGTFSHTFDFLVGPKGWQPVYDGSDPRATYNLGNGWDENPSYVKSRLSIYFPSFPARVFTGATLVNSEALGGNFLFQSIYYGAEEFDITAAGPSMSWPGSSGTCDTIRIDLSNDSNPNGRSMDGYVVSITLTGLGTDPFI
jgi:hypothetical protein